MSEGAPDVAAELRALRDEVASLREELAAGRGAEPADPASSGSSPSFAWLTSLEAPARRRLAVPRLLLEAAFLAAVAAVAALAELGPLVVVAVMAGAWALVALAELAATRAERRREELLYAPPIVAAEPAADPAWFSPPVEQTMLDDGFSGESETAVAKLPPLVDVEQTDERKPA